MRYKIYSCQSYRVYVGTWRASNSSNLYRRSFMCPYRAHVNMNIATKQKQAVFGCFSLVNGSYKH